MNVGAAIIPLPDSTTTLCVLQSLFLTPSAVGNDFISTFFYIIMILSLSAKQGKGCL